MNDNEPLRKKFKTGFEETVTFCANDLNLENSEKQPINDHQENKNEFIKFPKNSIISSSENLQYDAMNELPSTSKNPYELDKNISNKISSPKKRLECTTVVQNKPKLIFHYGNYSRYYGYRNIKDFKDIRLEVFAKYKSLFEGKDILDIGCNSGLLTLKIAEDNQNFGIKSIIGLDIDKTLINKATKLIEKKRRNFEGKLEEKSKFPFNIKFIHGNYVLRNDVLLEIEKEQFDLIFCLSVTKWIHLNFGDTGLKQAFKRMFLQIRTGGFLILEPQPWISYKRRKNLTPEIHKNYKNIEFFPDEFVKYLLGPEIGFYELKILETPEHPSKGFRRPLQLFYKK